jgi:hypothetical protein
VSIVSVVIVPEEMDRLALDSLSDALEMIRRDSTQLIVTLGYPKPLVPLPGRTFSDARRLQTIDRVVRVLRPDILLPAEDPYDSGTRAAGQRAPQYWESYITRASQIAKSIRPRTRIGVSASAYDGRDSTLFAWAAAPGSPVDVVGSRCSRRAPACARSTRRRTPRIAGCASPARRRNTGSSPPAASRSARRGEPGARRVGRPRLGHEPPGDQGPDRERSRRLRLDHRPPRPRRPPSRARRSR